MKDGFRSSGGTAPLRGETTIATERLAAIAAHRGDRRAACIFTKGRWRSRLSRICKRRADTIGEDLAQYQGDAGRTAMHYLPTRPGGKKKTTR